MLGHTILRVCVFFVNVSSLVCSACEILVKSSGSTELSVETPLATEDTSRLSSKGAMKGAYMTHTLRRENYINYTKGGWGHGHGGGSTRGRRRADTPATHVSELRAVTPVTSHTRLTGLARGGRGGENRGTELRGAAVSAHSGYNNPCQGVVAWL